MSWGTPAYTDNSMATPRRCSLPVYSSPIPGVSTEYLLDEEWMCLRTGFTPLAMDTAHSEDSSFYLVGESERKDMGCGVVRWTRSYAKIPSNWTDYESFTYSFIGLAPNGWPEPGWAPYQGRYRFTRVVSSQLLHEYFLCATGQTYTTPGAVPINEEQKFVLNYGSYSGGNYFSDFLVAAANTYPTLPTTETYATWVSNATAYGWSAGATPSGTNPGKMVAEASKLSRWRGNIWERVTRYVLAA